MPAEAGFAERTVANMRGLPLPCTATRNQLPPPSTQLRRFEESPRLGPAGQRNSGLRFLSSVRLAPPTRPESPLITEQVNSEKTTVHRRACPSPQGQVSPNELLDFLVNLRVKIGHYWT